MQNQLDAGIVSRVDLAQAQTQLEQTRAQLVAENITRATFEHAVAVLAGNYDTPDQWVPPTRVMREVVLASITA